MRRIASALLPAVALAAAMLLAAGPFDDRDLKSFKTEDIAKTLRFADPATPGELVIDNVFGPISVEGHAGRDIVLEARKIVYARDEARAKKAEEEVRLDITEKGNTVEAYVDGPFREETGGDVRLRGARRYFAHVDEASATNDRRGGGVHFHRDPGYKVFYGFTVKVPYGTDLVLSAVLDGQVEVRGVEGRFDVRNVNGRVRLLDVAGAGDARTVNGEVTVVFRRNPDGACLFKTVNGDVEVALPGAPSADFRVKTMHGEVYSDFDVTYLPKAPPIREERREERGKYVYRSDGAYGVRVGKGGPEIKLETLTGDILIAKRSKS